MERTAFLATVQSVSGSKAEMLLNDGKTICTVPTCFNNGEVETGARVLVMLAEEPSLFGSGEHKEYDYAVIYADTMVYDVECRSFEKDAYGVFKTDGSRTLKFVSISEAENGQCAERFASAAYKNRQEISPARFFVCSKYSLIVIVFKFA